jgi:hypothetical protein
MYRHSTGSHGGQMQDYIDESSLVAARETARTWSLDLLKEGFREGEDRRGWTLSITDDAGAVLFAATLAQAVGPDLVDTLN